MQFAKGVPPVSFVPLSLLNTRLKYETLSNVGFRSSSHLFQKETHNLPKRDKRDKGTGDKQKQLKKPHSGREGEGVSILIFIYIFLIYLI